MKDILHHLFLPRESNNFRAKILHHKSLLFFITAFFFGSFFLSSLQGNYSDVLGVSAASVSIPDLLTMTNQKRAENGLPPLTTDDRLTQAAAAKANFMLQKNFWAHNSPDGVTPWTFIKDANYPYVYAGENLARGFNSASDVVNAWMASPGHRENMLSPHYKDIGFAVVAGSLTGEDTVLVVEMLGSKTGGEETLTNAAKIIATPTPDQFVKTAQLTPTPVISLQPAISPSGTGTTGKKPTSLVASLQNVPLVNKKPFTKNVSLIIVLILLAVLIVDVIVLMKTKVKRTFTHTLDHIIFLCVMLIVIFILTKGSIL